MPEMEAKFRRNLRSLPQLMPHSKNRRAVVGQSGVGQARVVITWVKKAYRWVGRGVGRCIILLLDLPLRRHAIILTTKNRPPSISSITLSLAATAHPQGIRRRPSSPLTLPLGPPRDVVDESSSDDGGFLAPRPLRYFPRGRRRFNLVLPGSFVPSSSLIRPENLIPRPFASSPVPRSQHSRSRSASSSFFSPDLNFNLSSVPRFPVLVQVHQPPYLWGTATTGRHYHPHPSVSDPTPPPWEAERIRDNLARDLDYLERQVPPFVKRSLVAVPEKSASGSSVRFQEKSSSSGFQSASKNTTSTIPSGQSSAGEIMLRPIALPEDQALVQTLYSSYPLLPYRSLPPRTYENWPRRESTPPIYAMARSPSFDVEDIPATTVPASEPSPSTRTLLDMSVDDPYEFDPVIPDTSPEIVYPPQPHPSTTTSTTSSSSRFKRSREKYENMEARVAAMKEEFFEYRRRQKKRMESAC
ncbi:unnamed protein product [Allacma fusca]|uniref:Uncharacterized protein n=1 Tax=Allacma fusca TaxID=39272 RepID=A0A8J2L4V7_9HEXA|nr:unnamed protein product [Allacma fusca]